jgi:protein-S-isoprenylcysteine O-methyltransferase Ste14
MKATDFEFRQRFWLISLVYWLGFSLYRFDHLNVVQWAAISAAPGDERQQMVILRGLFIAGALMVLLAAGLRTWAAAYLRSDVVQDPSLHAEKIVADGPYRHMRNPLYLGGMLLAVGIGLLASRLGFLVIVVGLAIVMLRLMGLEESNLAREQGQSYLEFCKKVPRIWPALRPRVSRGGVVPRWGQAFMGEIFMWGFFVAMAAFVVTLNVRTTWWIIAVALTLYVVRSYFLYFRRRRAERANMQPN